jgi:hypothetical protein
MIHFQQQDPASSQSMALPSLLASLLCFWGPSQLLLVPNKLLLQVHLEESSALEITVFCRLICTIL